MPFLLLIIHNHHHLASSCKFLSTTVQASNGQYISWIGLDSLRARSYYVPPSTEQYFANRRDDLRACMYWSGLWGQSLGPFFEPLCAQEPCWNHTRFSRVPIQNCFIFWSLTKCWQFAGNWRISSPYVVPHSSECTYLSRCTYVSVPKVPRLILTAFVELSPSCKYSWIRAR